MRRNGGVSEVGVFVGLMVVALVGCGSSGSGGGTGGISGTGGAGTGGAGGGTFQAVAPCNAEGDYASGGNTIMFGPTAAYSPKCLKVAPGSAVTFSGDFTVHPLEPSALRGTLTGHPITATTTGASKAFTFTSKGFWAYFCSIHGASDSGAGMVGVVWVE